MTEELLPCPFCGSTELLGDFYINRNLHESYAIFCTNCDATLRGYTKSEVIDAWNSRAEPIGNSDELKRFTTAELVAELSKRDNVTKYPRWVTSEEVFGHRQTLDGKYTMLVVRE